MHESMGEDPSGAEWRRSAERMFARRLRDEPETFVAFVVDAPDATLVSSGVGWISEHLPSTWNVTGRRGHIASMSTEVAVRRQGHARQIMVALLEWFDSRGITRIDLTATPMGAPLYRSLGFADHGNGVPLVRRVEDLGR